jgi:long-chain acyl-CoA synthetase
MLKERELHTVLADSGAVLVLAMTDLAETATAAARGTAVRQVVPTSPLHYLESIPPALAGFDEDPGATAYAEMISAHEGETPAPAALAPELTALFVYTSGTTGPPKGAIITHGGICHAPELLLAWAPFDSGTDVNLAAAPLFHISGLVVGIGASLLVPMPLVLHYRFDPAEALALIERHRATFTLTAITAFTAMLNEPSLAQRDISSLTKVASGGAPVPPAVVEAWEAATGHYIHNGYGLTESTAGTHLVPYGARGPVDPASGALSVGVPLPSTDAMIVDDDGTEVPHGEVGNVLLAGPQLAHGYWNKPEETARQFAGGWLKTGDVGFIDEEGWLYLVDRRKDLIIASGYKVWPREVEDALYEHPAVRECAVVGVPDEYRGETVKAFVSLKPHETATPDELIAFARDRLAAYKYPRMVELLDELPKTLSGKILRRELREVVR